MPDLTGLGLDSYAILRTSDNSILNETHSQVEIVMPVIHGHGQ
jgi:hypothetical protein